MIERPNLEQEIYNFIAKILIPSIIAISIKVATQIKREKMTVLKVILSFVTGIGCAYFTYPFVFDNVEDNYLPLIVGIVSISGEKIAEYLIYKFNVDLFLTSIIDAVRQIIIKTLTK